MTKSITLGGVLYEFDCEPIEQPPDDVEIHIADDVFVKQMLIKRAGTLIPQHSHKYEHLSMLATGSVRVWKDDQLLGDFVAPTGIMIAAHAKHMFLSLEPDTIVYCIHNVTRADAIEVEQENTVLGV